jgi:hypothetical protein
MPVPAGRTQQRPIGLCRRQGREAASHRRCLSGSCIQCPVTSSHVDARRYVRAYECMRNPNIRCTEDGRHLRSAPKARSAEAPSYLRPTRLRSQPSGTRAAQQARATFGLMSSRTIAERHGADAADAQRHGSRDKPSATQRAQVHQLLRVGVGSLDGPLRVCGEPRGEPKLDALLEPFLRCGLGFLAVTRPPG